MPPVKQQPPTPDVPPADPPADVPEPGEPAWARELKLMLNDLPGKLRATLTDDDRRSIGEHVHELFERSGAFIKDPPKDTPEDPEDEPENPTDPTDVEPGGDSFARRWFGRW